MSNKFNKNFDHRKGNEVQLVQSYQMGVDKGSRFSAFAEATGVTTFNIYLDMDSTEDCEFKISFNGSSSEASSIRIYEDPTITDNGTEITLQNKRRDVQGVNTCPHDFYSGATFTDRGTQIAYTQFIGSSGGFFGGNSTGSAIGTDEFIPLNTKGYLLVIDSADGVQNFSLEMNVSGATYFNS